jgi:Fe-S-cluster containining protein
MGSILCEHCTGTCCRYVALPLDKPANRRDFDDIRWYVMHKGISVFVEDGDWYVQIAAVCENLLPDNRCGVYEHRPAICREYEAGDCDYAGGEYHYELMLHTPAEVEAYAIKKLGKKGVFTTPPKAPQRGSNGALRSLKVLTRHA